MIFLQPAALFGILALALPLTLYFVKKKQTRTTSWAAIGLLRAALARVPVRNEKREWNLLLLRCLIILLLCLAFARPVLNFSGTLTRMASGPVRAVIVMDDSGSMLAHKEARSSFDEAKQAASRLIRNLDPGSTAALTLGSGSAAGGVLKFEADMATLQKKLQAVQPGENATDLWPGIRAAVDLLVREGGLQREIFVVTDNQALAWKRIAEIEGLLGTKREILFQVLEVGGGASGNLALTELALDGGIPAAGKSVGVHATVANFGPDKVENIRVTLRADDLSPSDQAVLVKLESGEKAMVRLFASLPGPGRHSLTVQLPPDSLAYDNERSLVLEAMQQIRVLIVEGSNVPIPSDRDGYFLAHALAPVSAKEKKDHHVQIQTAMPADLEKGDLKQYQIVMLSNVSKLTPTAAQSLAGFVGEGGGLAIFPGPNTDLLYYNTDRIFGPLLPARLETPKNAPAEKKFISLQKGPFTHPLMNSWRGLAAESLGKVHYTSYFPLTLPAGESSNGISVVLALADGQPALIEGRLGEGRILLFNSTASPRWNNFPLHPSFVPLIQSLAGYLSKQRDEGLVLKTGEEFVRRVDPGWAGKKFRVEGPGAAYSGEVAASGNEVLLKFGGTEKGGVYKVFMEKSKQPEFVFVVQPDAAESDLRKLSLRELNSFKTTSGFSSGTRLLVSKKTGHELWMELGLLIFVLGLAEVFLACRLNRSEPGA